MINKTFDKKNIEKLLVIFLIIRPILDIYILFEDSVVSFFKFSPSTIIRMIMIAILLLMVIFSIKLNKKYSWFIGYGVCLIIYLILHHYNALNFKVNLSGTYNYSLLSELFYIIRMLLPFTITFIVYHVDLKTKDISKIIVMISLIISITIIITNICCISLPSYGTNFERIKGNIFTWFFKTYNNVELSSRGFFNSANQLGPLLSMLLPILLLFAIKENKKIYFTTIILVIITLLMIGTRISSYFWIFIFIVMFILYLYFSLITKNIKFEKEVVLKIITIFICSIILLQFSPIQSRKYSGDYKEIYKELEPKEDDLDSDQTIDDANKYYNFVKSNYMNYPISKVYIEEIYDYRYDSEFWYNVFMLPYDEISDSRKIEKLMFDRVYKLNSNSNDKWFGMSFSRLRNGDLYLERDFELHFYTLGIFGSILFVYPYIFIILLVGIIMIKKFKEIKFDNVVYIFSIMLFIIFGYLAGSVLDQLVVTLIAGFILGLIVKNIFRKDDECEES